MYAKSGDLVEPSGKEGGFSKDNWGDYIVKGAGSTADRLVRRSTFFKARILTLSEKHWGMIMESAASFINEKKSQKSLQVSEAALVVDDSPEQQQKYNELLHDPMFD
jgi:ATP-dependent protease HslVU (ClpYQ) peptidase subunit